MMLCLPCQRLKKEGITSSHIVAAIMLGVIFQNLARSTSRRAVLFARYSEVRIHFFVQQRRRTYVRRVRIPILARHDIVGLFNDSHTTVERCVLDPTALNKLNRPLKYAASMLRCDPPVH
jgi:hypothetical protein